MLQGPKNLLMTFFCFRLTTVCLNSQESLAPSPVYVVSLCGCFLRVKEFNWTAFSFPSLRLKMNRIFLKETSCVSDALGVLGSTPPGSVALDGGAAGLLTKVLGKINIPAGGL